MSGVHAAVYRSRLGSVVLLPALVALAALAAGPLSATSLEVAMVRPSAGQPAFGATAVEVQIYPPTADVERVEFYLDGLLAGVLTEQPWELDVDAGEGNREHLFEVVAFTRDGEVASTTSRTPALRVDLEIDVELRQLYMSLSGPGIESLTEADFTVYDQGVRQKIVTFERGDVPFTAVLLLDASTSMRDDKLPLAVAGVRSLVDSMNPLDEAKLILFSDRVLRETPFTSFSSILRLGLGQVEPGGGTAVNDAVYLALNRLADRQGRRVVILLSDGVDVESVLPMADVRRRAQTGQAVYYWIRLEKPEHLGPEVRRYTAWRDAEAHRRELGQLEKLVLESGGRVLPIVEVGGIRGALAELLAELRGQYVIGYYPVPEVSDDEWREVMVEVARRGISVRTRSGYFQR